MYVTTEAATLSACNEIDIALWANQSRVIPLGTGEESPRRTVALIDLPISEIGEILDAVDLTHDERFAILHHAGSTLVYVSEPDGARVLVCEDEHHASLYFDALTHLTD